MTTCEKPAVCFVAHHAYGALIGGNVGHIGGIEHQQALMAKWLARRGWTVSMLTWDHGQPNGQVVDGVRVHTICGPREGLPGVRFLHPRWTGLVSAMRRADADVYYQNCGEYVTGQVALWCRRNGRKFVYSVASDPDCDADLPEMHTIRERVLYRYGLRHADRVIAQTRRQQEMLRQGFCRESEVIPMPCPGPTNGEYVAPSLVDGARKRILWIGRVCEVKRPDRLIALAKACPELVFDLVGPYEGSEDAAAVVARARDVANIQVHGPAARDEVPGFYQRASCMVCTSAFEGFPNTFLEAWSHGLPIVSTFDPDDLIATRNLGRVAADVPGLAAGLRDLLTSPPQWREASRNARAYYVANHAVDVVMPKFERIFLELAEQRRTRDPRSHRR